MPEHLDNVVELCHDCDLVINNSFISGAQLTLLKKIKYLVPKIVVCGSIANVYPWTVLVDKPYVEIKTELAKVCNLLNSKDDDKMAKILHLNLGFLEPEGDLDFNTVFKAIEFWLDNPKITNIDFLWKFTNTLQQEHIKDVEKFRHILSYRKQLNESQG